MLKHNFKSLKADPADPTIIGATKWNDDHVLKDSAGAAVGALGDLVYRGTDGTIALLSGAAGILTSSGPGTVPVWDPTLSLTSVDVTTATIGGVTLDGTDAAVIDGITPGTIVASKAVVVDANKDAASFRNLTLTGALTAGTVVVGGTTLDAAELAVLDGVTPGTVAASKAVVVDANRDAINFRHLATTGNVQVGADLIVGGTTFNAAELGVLDGVTPGTVVASKAVVVDANKDIASFRHLTAAGQLRAADGTAAAPALAFAGNLASGWYHTGTGASSVVRLAVNGTANMLIIDSTGVCYAASTGAFAFLSRSVISSPNNGLLNISNAATSAGVGLDVATDGTLKIRNRAQNADANLHAAALSLGTNPADAGQIRLATGNQINWRNAANTANASLVRFFSDVSEFGDSSFSTILKGSPVRVRSVGLGTPGSLSDGEWWVEASGTSPARVAAIKVRDGGTTRTIASITY